MLGCCCKSVGVIVVVLAVAMGVGIQILSSYPELRHKFFAGFCYQAGVVHAIPEFEHLRCELMKDLEGPVVVEIGPGPGTNFVCLKDNKSVKKWVGIEPNQYMRDYLFELAKKLSISFEIDLKGIPGESLPIDTASADSVVGTHLLCSVHNATQVLHEIARILKPGGKYYFLEHVSAPNGTFKRSFQDTIEPTWSVLGDGCKFEETWVELDKMVDQLDVNYKHMDAPLPAIVGFASPHIIGVATKKHPTAS